MGGPWGYRDPYLQAGTRGFCGNAGGPAWPPYNNLNAGFGCLVTSGTQSTSSDMAVRVHEVTLVASSPRPLTDSTYNRVALGVIT